MSKQKISANAFPYPMPMVVVSSVVEGRVNHMAVGWVSRVNARPPLLAVALGKRHHTNRGLHEHREFGLSVPSLDQVRAVDHVGLVSGASTDKSDVFAVFHGALEHAPMIESFPVTMACRVVQVVDLPTNELFIGEIVEAYCEAGCLTDDLPDIEKIRPFTLTLPDNRYWQTGGCLGQAWSIGKGFSAA
jgi:flavin reductase (DIM6/NTAB) family NADH-FMN oxidoreductase RutF